MGDVPHELYGYIDGSEPCSAARWAEDAKRTIAKAHAQNKLPIIVGGTGLYVRTLLDGIAPIPDIDPEIRSKVRNSDTLEAYQALQIEDAVSAKRLQPNDTNRIKRALEIIRSTGKTMDHWHRHMTGGIADEISLKAAVLLPPRDWLHERCNIRFMQMIERGARKEVEALLVLNLPDDCPVSRAIGVREITALIEGKVDESEAISLAQAATRQYAKRQYTWFRNQCPEDWPCIDEIINVDNVNNIVRILQ